MTDDTQNTKGRGAEVINLAARRAEKQGTTVGRNSQGEHPVRSAEEREKDIRLTEKFEHAAAVIDDFDAREFIQESNPVLRERMLLNLSEQIVERLEVADPVGDIQGVIMKQLSSVFTEATFPVGQEKSPKNIEKMFYTAKLSVVTGLITNSQKLGFSS